MTQVVAGDIGGTNARFRLIDEEGGKAGPVLHQEVLESKAFSTFEAALARFLETARTKIGKKAKSKIVAASFGIAGPVVDQRVKTTNLPWLIDARSIAEEFAIPRVTLLNDLVAVGLGALAAPPSKVTSIHCGRPRTKGGNIAVIAAGTGLGEATFVWDGTTHIGCPTEGGHVDFAPQTPVEIDLWKILQREHGHVSYERIASGSTIHSLYTFFVRDQGVAESKANAAVVVGARDKNPAVVELAESGKSEAAMRAIDLWASVYGAEAGNLALKSLATSGVFVCGGASARLAKILAAGLPARRKKGAGAGAGAKGAHSPFIAAFLDKGRMRPLLEKIPVAVCTEPLAGLLGAGNHAASQSAMRMRAR
jgi:glucokinase